MIKHVTPGQAIWNQRRKLGSMADRLRALIKAVDRPSDLAPFQWAQIAAFALEFRPNLVIELGRGLGNSTCCFLEVADQLRDQVPYRLLSLCRTHDWFTVTLPRLEGLCRDEWFARGRILECDILEFDFADEVKNAERCLVLWDAHGFQVAECVLGKLLPLIAKRPHVVVMHDMFDLTYDGQPPAAYGTAGLWKGDNATSEYYWLGNICSSVAQGISIIDFSTRNKMPLHTGAESLHKELKGDPAKIAELQRLLGNDLFSLSACWFWFSMNEAAAPFTFPYVKLGQAGPAANAA